MRRIPAYWRQLSKLTQLIVASVALCILGAFSLYGYHLVVGKSTAAIQDQTGPQLATVFPKLTFRPPPDVPATKKQTANTATPVKTTEKPVWQIPILMYHYVRTVDANADPLGFRLSVTREQFSQQLDWLKSQGYHTIDPSLLLQKKPLPAKSILITFDDGYEDFYTDGWPVLKAHEFNAIMFMPSGFVGRDLYLTSDQIKQLSLEGAVIGAHTIDHVNLTTQTPDRLVAQLLEPKQQLTHLIGRSVPWIAYPSGKYDDVVLAATKEAGYTFGVTTHFGLATSLDDPLALHRIEVLGSDPMEDFQLKTQGILPKHTNNQ